MERLTRLQIYKLAYYQLLELWSREYDRVEKSKKEGYENPISNALLERYNEEMSELHDEIIRLECRRTENF